MNMVNFIISTASLNSEQQSREASELAANEELIGDVQLIKANMILPVTYRPTVEFLCNQPAHSFQWKKSTPVNMYGTQWSYYMHERLSAQSAGCVMLSVLLSA